MNKPQPFEYPVARHVRRHGPSGYRNYQEFKDWLRDEFSFRCVFCLKREMWDRSLGNFDIDHFVPNALDPTRRLDYDNLLYVCASCNAVKGDLLVPGPSSCAFGRCVRVRDDGTIEPLNRNGELLIRLLKLDDEDVTRFRSRMIVTLNALWKLGEHTICTQWMCYPDDLPDLSRKKPPRNERRDGIQTSHYARRSRGELPATY